MVQGTRKLLFLFIPSVPINYTAGQYFVVACLMLSLYLSKGNSRYE